MRHVPRRPPSILPANALIVRLDGEIDLITSNTLRERLLHALWYSGDRPFVCDLSEVTFCDAAGLAVLVAVERRARSLGRTFGLLAPTPTTARLLHLTGLDRGLTVYQAQPEEGAA